MSWRTSGSEIWSRWSGGRTSGLTKDLQVTLNISEQTLWATYQIYVWIRLCVETSLITVIKKDAAVLSGFSPKIVINQLHSSKRRLHSIFQYEPTWNLKDNFIINENQKVFALDCLESSHPISVPVEKPEEINQIFDTISYSKGKLKIVLVSWEKFCMKYICMKLFSV